MWLKLAQYIPWDTVVKSAPKIVAKAQQLYQEKIKKSPIEKNNFVEDNDVTSIETIKLKIIEIEREQGAVASVVDVLLQQNKELFDKQAKVQSMQKIIIVVLFFLCFLFSWLLFR